MIRQVSRAVRRTRRHLLSAAAILYMVGSTIWSLPAEIPGRAWVNTLFRSAIVRGGMMQGWNLFSPNPRAEDRYVEFAAVLRNGRRVAWAVSRMSDLSVAERYRRDRWRKFFNDPAYSSSLDATILDAMCRWAAREIAAREGVLPEDVVVVVMFRYFRACPKPSDGIDPFADHRPYRPRRVHVWRRNR